MAGVILFGLALIMGLVTGAAPAGFPYALALRGCTQEDAPALEVYLTREPYSGQGFPAKPYLRIEIAWSNWEQVVARDLELIPLSRQGVDPRKPVVRAEIDREQGSPVWLRGTLRLDRVAVDQQVDGSYNFVAPDGSGWTGTFKARWVTARSGCG